MKAPEKLPRQPADPPPGELARLKQVWLGFSDDARACWQDLFASKAKPAQIRKKLLARLGINLRYDAQLNVFRDWELRQRVLDQHGEWMQEIERRLTALHPDWTLDQVREEVLRKAYFVTLACGDFKLGLQTVAQNLNAKKFALGEAKAAEAMKDEQAKALEFCLGEAKKFPAVQKLFKTAFAAFRAANAGGAPTFPRGASQKLPPTQAPDGDAGRQSAAPQR